MPDSFISLTPSDLEVPQVYDILVAGIQPRPIAFISTKSAAGVANLAPYSFFIAGGANPPSIVYSPTLGKAGSKKHSLLNVEETGEFVVNAVTREMAESMKGYGATPPDTYDEWKMCGFTPIPSEIVAPARVAESPVQFECRLFALLQHGSNPSSACYVVGEVVKIHIQESVWDGYSIDPLRFRPISRMGGANYLDTNSLELFLLENPSENTKPS